VLGNTAVASMHQMVAVIAFQPRRKGESNMRNKILGQIAALAFAGTSLGFTGMAFAGTSANVNGCKSTWGSTGSSVACSPASVTMHFRNHASCSFSPDQNSGSIAITKGSSVTGVGQVNCTFSINSAIPQVLSTP
jgi:NO-binding membrane sensor protein with MHYT domain